MGYDIPGNLFTLLAAAKSQPAGWYKDLTAATGAAQSIADSYKGYQAAQRQKGLDQFFDTSVPAPVLNRLIPGAPTDGSITFRDLSNLAGSGVINLTKDPNSNVDVRTLAVLGSGGDPDKASKLMQMFSGQTGTDASGNPLPLSVNPSTIAAARTFIPKGGKSAGASATQARGASAASINPQVNTLKALQQTYMTQLKGDLSEADEQRISRNLDAVNKRLGQFTGVDIQGAPAVPPATAAPAVPAAAAPAAKPSVSGTSALVQQLLSALNK